MKAVNAKRAAEIFWDMAGERETYPRSLEAPAAWALPVAVVKLPRLWIADVQRELEAVGVQWKSSTPSRKLKGFMIAARGRGFVFLNGAESVEEQRYTLAHELAHFLLDYHLPRQFAIEQLGPSIVGVLDGVETPSVTQRVHASLSGIAIGTYEHSTGEGELSVPDREDTADQLAIELLAPEEEIWTRVRPLTNSTNKSKARELLTTVLHEEFGLPQFAASGTADAFVSRKWPRPSFREWLEI